MAEKITHTDTVDSAEQAEADLALRNLVIQVHEARRIFLLTTC
jgi:hypothetical protein